MFKKIFLILALVHILGDFYFQSEKLSKNKHESFFGVLIHSLIYALSCFALIVIITDEWIRIAAFAAAFVHFIVDTVKYNYIKKCKSSKNYPKEKDSIVYATDQIVHIFTFIVISLIVARNYSSINKLESIDELFKIAEISSYQVFTWFLIILFIGKPANITIKKLLLSYRPSINDTVTSARVIKERLTRVESIGALTDDSSQVVLTSDESQVVMVNDEKKAGGFIGFLERFIILIFLAINQYSAIGLVLTAKSIARYDKISKDQVFAEYYLLGTLLSALIVIIAYFLIM